MLANQTEGSKLEQKFVIKLSVAEKSKPCEIYRRMRDVHEENFFCQIMFTNLLNMSSPLQACVKKTVDGVDSN